MADPSPCPPVEELRRFLLGQLSEDEAGGLERHLVGCPRCAAGLDALRPGDPPPDEADETHYRPPPAPSELSGAATLSTVSHGVTPPPPRGPVLDAAEEAYDFLAPPGEPDELGRFGPYGVLRVLGRGGMGVVFAARQARPRRLVALKTILAGPYADRRRLARFRSETDIVARLQHPNIVPVYEAGEHAGRAYFTMEYVAGGSLAQRLAAAPLAPRAAAELVEALARAVHFAHERGFVHRDLKPANVFLTACGLAEDAMPQAASTPKIADFGLAKQLDSDDWTPGGQTESGAILGTPAYMAPEQAAGRSAEAGPAVDVYALGAILYECLTGRPPFKGATVLDTLEQVRTREPVPPGRLQPGLPRDLQTVCLKCLQKEPPRRYASARELADDLGRFRRGEPVRARPVSPGVRVAKWARRKPALAGLLAACGVLLVALVAGGLAYQARLRAAVERAAAQEAEARRQQELAANNYRAARDSLSRMLGRLEGKRLADVPRLKELRHDLLEDTLAFYQEVLKGEDNPDPAVRQDAAWAYMQTGAVQTLLGRGEPAATNFHRAVALLEGLPAGQRDGPDCRNLLAQCYSYLGALGGDTGRPEDMGRYYRRALAVYERLAAAEPDNAVWRNGVAEGEHHLGDVALLARRPAEAEPHYARAVALRDRLIHDHPGNDGYRAQQAEDYVNLGLLYHQTGRRDEAGATFARAEKLLAPLARAHPDEPDYALSLSAAYVNWGEMLREQGRAQAAAQRAGQAVDLAEAVLRREPRHAVARQRAFSAHGARAQASSALARWADAVKDWDRALELDEGADRWVWRVSRAVALAAAGQHARAVAEARELEEDPAVSADGLRDLALAYAVAGEAARVDFRLPAAERVARAEDHASRAVAVLRKLEARGYFKDRARAERLGTDDGLRSLRGRDDFRRLLAAVGNE